MAGQRLDAGVVQRRVIRHVIDDIPVDLAAVVDHVRVVVVVGRDSVLVDKAVEFDVGLVLITVGRVIEQEHHGIDLSLPLDAVKIQGGVGRKVQIEGGLGMAVHPFVDDLQVGAQRLVEHMAVILEADVIRALVGSNGHIQAVFCVAVVPDKGLVQVGMGAGKRGKHGLRAGVEQDILVEQILDIV